MRLVSLNTGMPKEIKWRGKKSLTSIYKTSVDDEQKVNLLGIENDTQSDRRVHGGIYKAVYSYDVEFYEHWKKIIDRDDWVYGMFGENLTTEGLTDKKVKVGNIYKIGTSKVMAVQPRFPCQTLCARFGIKDMIQLFVDQKRHGTYFRVIEEGHLKVNDKIQLIEESEFDATIEDVTEARFSKGSDKNKLKQILDNPNTPDDLKSALHIYL